MATFKIGDKKYRVDNEGYLLDPLQWDEDFARAKAKEVGIEELTEAHWKVIYFIRHNFQVIGRCPLVYVAAKENHLGLGNLEKLFPKGYLRGVCKIAGVTYRECFMQDYWMKENFRQLSWKYGNKGYHTDAQGFLLNPDEWDENFALRLAYALKMPDYLTEKHWKVIYYLRKVYKERNMVPTIFETCKDNDMELEELEQLFPDGYHRGAVKIAGLRVH